MYMKYIATRPRAERLGSHGLFGDADSIDLANAMSELENYNGNVWTHIISLHREDAARLGYDSAEAWRNLLRTHRNDIAEAMKIPPKDFRWYAAFHDEGHHPHVHVMAWSAQPGQAYLSREGIRQIKSKLTNDIFKHEMLHLYEQKSDMRDELVEEARRELLELTREMRDGIYEHPVMEQLMQELSMQLELVKGKKSYGYLPKKVKAQVDKIVDELERVPVVATCYNKWLELQGQVESYYKDKPMSHAPLSQQKEFRAIKNAIIHEAEHLRLDEVTFEDADISQVDEQVELLGDYWYLREIIYNSEYSLEERDDAVRELYDLAESGSEDAQFLMGKLYRDGPLLIPDSVEARYWSEQAARQGHAMAQYALGKLLLSDDIEVHDVENGMYWLQVASRNGNDYAAYRLGKEYLTREKNVGMAMDYFTQSASAGNPFAQYMLGKLLLEEDEWQALHWFERAAEQGHPYAQCFLDRQDNLNTPSAMLSVTRLLYHVSRIFRENASPQSGQNGLHIDRKRRQQLMQKRIALGHKPDDHEEEPTWQQTM